MRWIGSSFRRLREAHLDALGVALLVLVTAFVFAAAPRLIDSLASQAVRDEVRAAPPVSANLEVTEVMRIAPGTGAGLDRVQLHGDALGAQLPPAVQALIASRAYVVDTPRWLITSPLPEPGTLTMRFQEGAEDRVAFTAGRAPTGATHLLPGEEPSAGAGAATSSGPITVFEIAISEETAATLQVRIGELLSLSLDGTDGLVGAAGAGPQRCAAEIVGIFRPSNPADPAWYAENGLLRASTRVYGPSYAINDGRALMAPDAYRPLMELTAAARVPLRYQWRFFVDPERIDARGLAGLTAALQRTESIFPKASGAVTSTGPARLTSALAGLLDDFRTRWSFALVVMATGAAGPAAMALAALGFIAFLVARRRRSVVSAWRMRGASTIQVLSATLAEGLLAGGPAALVGTGLAIGLVGSGPPEPSLLAGGAVLGAAMILVGMLEIPPALAPRARDGTSGDDLTLGASASGRRFGGRSIAAEMVVVVLAIAAIAMLRQRGGAADAGTLPSANPLLAAAPALGGIAAALLARRLVPFPIRALARLAARRGDLPTVHAMRRAGRQGSLGPVLVVLLASSAITIFSTAMVLSLSRGADLVAWQTVGADFRVSGSFGQLPDGFDAAALPGVTASAAAYRGRASVATYLGSYDLLAVDAPAYAALADSTPADPALPPEMLEAKPTTLPVILSSVAAARTGVSRPGQAFDLYVQSERIPAHLVAIRDTFPTMSAGNGFMVISWSQVTAMGASPTLRPTDFFLSAPPSAREALLATLSPLGPGVQLQSRADEAAALRDQPVNRAVVIVVLAAAAIAAAYAALALLVGLALAGSARSIEVAHLRMLGLARRDATALIALEHGPVIGLALLAGGALGLGLFTVLGSALGLGALLGTSLEIPLSVEPGPLALVVLATVAVAGLAIGIASLLQGRAAAAEAIRRGIE